MAGMCLPLCGEWELKCLLFVCLEGKAARKNRKRRDKKPCVGGGFTLEEEVPGKPPSPPLVDPLTDLQIQLVQAKADKVSSQPLCVQLLVCVCVCV